MFVVFCDSRFKIIFCPKLPPSDVNSPGLQMCDQILLLELSLFILINVWEYNTCNINKHSHPFQIHFIPTVRFYFEIINHMHKPY